VATVRSHSLRTRDFRACEACVLRSPSAFAACGRSNVTSPDVVVNVPVVVVVLTCCWSVKGGSGVTVVAAGLALRAARSGPSILIDLCGDLPAALGVPEPDGPGIAEWLRRGVTIRGPLPLISVGRGLQLVPRGRGALLPVGLDWLAGQGTVIMDAGVIDDAGDPRALALGRADRSLLVLRPCYLALRRAVRVGIRPHGIVLVVEPNRALGAEDVETVLGAPVVAEVPVDPAVSRAVDAGLLVHRCPTALTHSLEATTR
jgi:hypothetical protein